MDIPSTLESLIKSGRFNEEEVRFIGELLKKKQAENKDVVIHFVEGDTSSYPRVDRLVVLAPDWPGVLEGCTSCIHRLGLNLQYVKAGSFRWNDTQLAVFFLDIEIKNEEEAALFDQSRAAMFRTLEFLAIGGKAKRDLLFEGMVKLQFFEATLNELSKMLGKNIPPEIREEAALFFHSRSEAYIRERKVKDLARLILTNYEFIKKVRETGFPQVKVEHIETTREKLTGISIAAFDRDLSMQDVLSSIAEVVPDYTIRYEKKFITDDGIAVYRLELAGFLEVDKLKQSIYQALLKKRLRYIKSLGVRRHIEYYARVVLPQLIKEYRYSKIPQIFITPTLASREEISFKLIIVEAKGNKSFSKLLERIDSKPGFMVVNSEPPRPLMDTQYFTIEVQADLRVIPIIEKVYETLHAVLSEVFGEFRDFDEGVRKQDMARINALRKEFPAFWEIAREFYYSMDDFYRLEVAEDELHELIKLGVEIYKRMQKERKELVTEVQHLDNATILAIGTLRPLPATLYTKLDRYKPVINQTTIGDVHYYLIKLSSNNKPLSEEEIDEIIRWVQPH